MLQGLSCFAATIQHGSAVVGWQHGFGALPACELSLAIHV